MFHSEHEEIEAGRIVRYRVVVDGAEATYERVLELWRTSSGFRIFFNSLLAESAFSAYRWETPPISLGTLSRTFEFVLINSPAFFSREADSATFDSYFTNEEKDCGIVSFANLSGDATLVVPSPRGFDSAYGHLAAFVRNAPASQIDYVWQILSKSVMSQLREEPIWINTAGGGVAWLHLRIDKRPKYYDYVPYKEF